MSVMVAITLRVPIIIWYARPRNSGVSSIQTTQPSIWSARRGGVPDATTSPRETSISRSSTSVTASPAWASARSPCIVTMRATCATSPRIGVHHPVAGAQRAGGDGAAIAAKPVVRAVDVLHRHAEWLCRRFRRGRRRFQRFQQCRAAVPRHVRTRAGHVVAVPRDDRNGGHGQRAELGAQRGEVGHDVVEHRLVVADQVHLVDRQDQLADAQQRSDGGVAAGLHQQPLACIHQQYREIRGRGAGNHVAGVLMVPRRIGQDEPGGGASRRSDRRRRW